jgi:3-oxoacyl-[acyl-carrier-protein] synthase II
VTAVIATRWSVHLPGVALAEAVAGQFGEPSGDWARADAVTAGEAASVLGRKGLLAVEPATRLALCAVHRALGLRPGERRTAPPCPRTAVVACGGLGNVEAVARVARTVAAEDGRAVSVLDAPNVSANILASTVALWFGFGGPNLMVSSGPAAGLDGLRFAALLLRGGRARRVVLVGAEPDDEVARALYGRPLRAGAGCLVLTAGGSREALPGEVLVASVDGRPPARTVTTTWGDCYGAQGVVALALAAHLVADEGHGVVSVAGGSRAAMVRRARGRDRCP